MTKTLIIHPSDSSTDFLKPIYAKILDATIITSGNRGQVNEETMKHDRIIMMGHGSPWGLFSVGQFAGIEGKHNGYVIDHDTVSLLRDKENIFIWCNADRFVNRHELNGFYSGMFISEVSEAYSCGLKGILQDVVDESNNTFAELLGGVINQPLYEAYQHTKYYYEQLAEVNAVAEYNSARLYLN